MADRVLILAESGAGKSTSIRNLDPKETFIINCLSKALPFRGWKSKYTLLTKDNPDGNLFNSVNGSTIMGTMKYVNDKRPEVKMLIIDDFNYISAYKLFDKAKETGYNKFTDTALEIKQIATLPESFRDDLIVVYMMHPEVDTDIDGNKRITPKIGGKMITNQLVLEGLFDKVLYCKPRTAKGGKGIEYGFETRKSEISSPAKTPMGLFEEEFIPNDLELVKQAILEYEK